MKKEWTRYNLRVGPYEFVQDVSNIRKFHVPGSRIVDEPWAARLAHQNHWPMEKIYRGMDGRADNEIRRQAHQGQWEVDTLKRWRDHYAGNQSTKSE